MTTRCRRKKSTLTRSRTPSTMLLACCLATTIPYHIPTRFYEQVCPPLKDTISLSVQYPAGASLLFSLVESTSHASTFSISAQTFSFGFFFFFYLLASLSRVSEFVNKTKKHLGVVIFLIINVMTESGSRVH